MIKKSKGILLGEKEATSPKAWGTGGDSDQPLEKGMETTLVFLHWEPQEQYEKANRYDTERSTP